MNVVYVAGGLNTRFEEYRIFPKILLPFKGNKSILIHNYEVFKDHPQYLIINSVYYDMVLNYVHINNLNITVIECKNFEGSYNSISSVFEHLPNNEILFIWSDLILSVVPTFNNTLKHPIIITKNGEYRFRFDGEIKEVESNGNIPGIYYIPESSILNKKFDFKYDLVEYLRDYHSVDSIEYAGKIIEFRDKKIYIDYLDRHVMSHEPRYFNSLDMSNDKVKKAVTHPDYIHLIKKEQNWYNYILNWACQSDLVPQIFKFGERSIEMERLDGYETLFQYITWCETTGPMDHMEAIDSAIMALMKLHNVKKRIDEEIIKMDLRIEFYNKVLDRVLSVKDILIDFDNDEFFELLSDAYIVIQNHFKDRYYYSFIHGDPNGSNVMYNPTLKKIKFIDPRGYFGKTELYGVPEYDFAKLNYFLYGYDHFNIYPYMYSKEKYTQPRTFYKHIFFENDIIKIMTAIIYISLTSYISNNVMKVNIAFHHGVKMLKEVLYGDKLQVGHKS